MPALPGLHEDRVWRVSLLQGHEEVRRTRPDETVLPPETVHGGESDTVHTRWGGLWYTWQGLLPGVTSAQ